MDNIIFEADRQSTFDAWDRVFRAGALKYPWGMGWGGRWEGGSGWGTHVHPWLIHVYVWQKPPQYYKIISLQLKFLKMQTIKKPKFWRWKYSNWIENFAAAAALLQSCPTLCNPIDGSPPGINSRFSHVQERISELENRSFVSVQLEEQNDKNFLKEEKWRVFKELME